MSKKTARRDCTIIYWKSIIEIHRCPFFGDNAEVKEQTDSLDANGFNWIVEEGIVTINVIG